MPTASERARELGPGPELDALFFETCWGWQRCGFGNGWLCDPESKWMENLSSLRRDLCVSTDAAACEAWVMRWLREYGFVVQLSLEFPDDASRAALCVIRGEPYLMHSYGTDWKHALTRAAIAAKEAMERHDG